MKSNEIIQQRLYNQGIMGSQFEDPGEVVKWLGAVQAQDFFGALWGIGLRMKSSSESIVEKAIGDKSIIRTWPMRGTLHFVAPDDVRWMLKLLTPRVIQRSAGTYRQAELDNVDFDKSREVIIKALEGGQQLSRDEMYKALEEAHIATKRQRGSLIIGHFAQKGLICLGPRREKKQTFVLLDEWLPISQNPDRDEALGMLAQRYFSSHGPAQLKDFAWWAGLTMADSKLAVEIAKSELEAQVVDDRIYWRSCQTLDFQIKADILQLLPGFDEFLLGYADRSDALISDKAKEVHYSVKNGMFNPTIVGDGQVIGVWKRTLKNGGVMVEAKTFSQLSKKQSQQLRDVAQKYSRFLDERLSLELIL